MILNPTQLSFQTWPQIPWLPKFTPIPRWLQKFTQMFRSDLFRSNVFYIKDEFDYKTLDKSKEIN
jgi:hypothetical protein